MRYTMDTVVKIDETPATKLEAVKALLEQGLYLYPLVAGTKIPAIKGGKGYQDATNDLAQWEQWINQYGYGVNIGLNLAKSGIITLDIDKHNAEQNGLKSLGTLLIAYPELETELSSYAESTPNDGTHVFFKYDHNGDEQKFDGINYNLNGLEILVDSTVIAPSTFEGKEYSVKDDTGTWLDLAPAPQKLINFINGVDLPSMKLSTPAQRASPAISSLEQFKAGLTVVQKGDGRDPYMATKVGWLLGAGFTIEDTLTEALEINENYMQPPMSYGHVKNIVNSIARREARKPKTQAAKRTRTTSPDTATSDRNGAYDGTYKLTDKGNKERFMAAYPNKYLCINAASTNPVVYMYNGKQWEIDETAQIKRDFANMVANMANEQIAIPADADAETRKKITSAWLKFIDKTESTKAARDALSQVRDDVAKAASVLDANKYLLNTPAGTLLADKATFKQHDRNDYLTMITNGKQVNADKFAGSRWKQFLSQTFEGDSELIEYIQRVAGYVLLGDNREQLFFILKGNGEKTNGSNGKSVFIEAIANALGDYSTNINADNIVEQRNNNANQASPELVTMKNKRLVVMSELRKGAKLDESKLKSLTGDGQFTVRGMYQAAQQMERTYTMFLLTNHLPEIVGTDNAIWRRIIPIPFNHLVKAADADTKLAETLKAEADIILTWMIDGLRSYLANGLSHPQSVLDEKDKFRADMDVVAQFVSDNITLVEDGTGVALKAVKTRYEQWQDETGADMTVAQFTKKFKERYTDTRYTDPITKKQVRGFINMTLN